VGDQYTLNCGLLRLFDDFDSQVDTRVPRFQYHFGGEELQTLRDRYCLEDVAGGGDDWQRVLNLLRWLSGNTCHNGSIVPSFPMNALSLLEYSFGKGKERGINCYMLATVLTEACLSVGLATRMLSLHPLNPYDYDNHVVTAVWCRPQARWVTVDPSFNAYLMDADGKVLNPWEVRDSLCRNRKVSCNAELGYNGEPYDAEAYLTYIAKDLFYMQCPLESRYGSAERWAEQRWVSLIPKGFDAVKRESYNQAWRGHRQDAPWDQQELDKAKDRAGKWNGQHVITNSVGSFALPPEPD